MNRRLRLTFICLVILSLLVSSLTSLATSEAPAKTAPNPSVVSIPVSTMFAATPELVAWVAGLPTGSGRIRSISSTNSISPQRYGIFVVQAKVSPAAQASLNDLVMMYDSSKLTYQTVKASISRTYMTLTFTFVAAGAPGGTNLSFYSNTRKSVKDTTKVTIKPVPVNSVSLDTTSATLTVGGTLQLNATVLPENASNRSVKWSSSSKSIATVSSAGLVTAKKIGKATITVATVSGGKKKTCKITVVKATPTPTPKPTPTPTPPPSSPVTYRALLIGNSDYPGTANDLRSGPYNDVTMLANALSRSSLNGLTYSGNIFTAEDFSANGILWAIDLMINKGIDSNDVTFFSYSGHGVQIAATEDQTGIVGTDNVYIDVPTLKAALDAIPGTVIVILDSCYSGMFIGKNGSKGMVKSPVTFNPIAYNKVIRDAFTTPAAKGLTTSKYHVITACRKGETSINVPALSTSGGMIYTGLATLFIAMGSGFDLYDTADTTLLADINHNNIATIKEVFDFADAEVDARVAALNDPEITQDMQYFTTNDNYPLFGRN